MDEKHSLEEQMRAVLDKCKYKRRQIRELHGDLQARLARGRHRRARALTPRSLLVAQFSFVIFQIDM